MTTFLIFSMINEPLIMKRYEEMSLTDLQSRELQLEAEQRSKGRLSKGQRTYRRRIKKAMDFREALQQAQQARYMHTPARSVNSHLTTQQR